MNAEFTLYSGTVKFLIKASAAEGERISWAISLEVPYAPAPDVYTTLKEDFSGLIPFEEGTATTPEEAAKFAAAYTLNHFRMQRGGKNLKKYDIFAHMVEQNWCEDIKNPGQPLILDRVI